MSSTTSTDVSAKIPEPGDDNLDREPAVGSPAKRLRINTPPDKSTTTLLFWPSTNKRGHPCVTLDCVVVGSQQAVANRARQESDCPLIGRVPPVVDGAGRLNGVDAASALKKLAAKGRETCGAEQSTEFAAMALVPWNRVMKPPSVETVFGKDGPTPPDGVSDLEVQIAFNQQGLPLITAAVGGWIGEKCDKDGELEQPEVWMACHLLPGQATALATAVDLVVGTAIATRLNAVSVYLGTK